jgi:hypothetical protein
VKHAITFAALAVGSLVLAAGPAPAVERAAIDAALARGVKQLKGQQLRDGTWPHEMIGATALAGLTLLECGVPPDDPAIQKAAEAVRAAAVNLTHTYSVSLAVLFLDRLGEPIDVALIESLAARLIGGQNKHGGWSYNCPDPGNAETRRLTALLKDRDALPKRDRDARREPKDLPKEVQALVEGARQGRGLLKREAVLDGGQGDNSNTQFAVLALWVARRHGLPADAALHEAEQRFRRTQNADGGWGYLPPGATEAGAPPNAGVLIPGTGSTPSMTCAGLLGLATAYGTWNDAALKNDPKGDDPSRPGAKLKDPGKDGAIRTGLRALGTAIGNPAGPRAGARIPRVTPAHGKVYYFLWSLERVAVAYGLETVGDKDWYNWGAEILLRNQDADGGWSNGEFAKGGPDTCFALLFLRRANLAEDLSRVLKGQVKDPAKVELSAGGIGGAGLAKGQGLKPIFGDPEEKPAGGADPAAAQIGSDLLRSVGVRQDELIEKLRDGKGSAYTDALAAVIPKLDGEPKKRAREALAERLTRMTAATLGDKLADDDLEVRRAAALASAMKEEKAHVPRLIALLDDPETPVARAAYAALKSLTGQDFGPAAEATRDEKAKAVAAWKDWWAKNGGK